MMAPQRYGSPPEIILPSELFDLTKYSGNPLITGTSAAASFYVPNAINPAGTYYIYGKSNDKTYGFSSADGLSWSNEALLLTEGTAGQFDSDHVESRCVQFNAGTYYLWYGGREVGAGDDQVGMATSSSPLSGWSKLPGAGNPWLSLTDFATDLPGEPPMIGILIGDHFILDGTHFFLGHVRQQDGPTNTKPSKMFYATGPDWTTKPTVQDILFTAHDVADQLRKPRDAFYVLQSPTFIRRNGDSLWCIFECGVLGDVWNERRLYAVRVNRSANTLTVDMPTVHECMTVGPPGDLDDRRVYQARWLKDQDGEFLTPSFVSGNYRLYYSIHDVAFPTQDAFGITGLAEATTIPGS